MFAGSAVAVLQIRTRKRNCRERGGSLVFFSVSLLKDLIAVLLFLCGIVQLDCTSLKELHGTLYLDICAFLTLFNLASGLLHSLGPVGDSLFSHLTSMALLCLLMF